MSFKGRPAGVRRLEQSSQARSRPESFTNSTLAEQMFRGKLDARGRGEDVLAQSLSKLGSFASLSGISDLRSSPMGSMVLIQQMQAEQSTQEKLQDIKTGVDRSLYDMLDELAAATIENRDNPSAEQELDRIKDIIQRVISLNTQTIIRDRATLKGMVIQLRAMRTASQVTSRNLLMRVTMIIARLSRALDATASGSPSPLQMSQLAMSGLSVKRSDSNIAVPVPQKSLQRSASESGLDEEDKLTPPQSGTSPRASSPRLTSHVISPRMTSARPTGSVHLDRHIVSLLMSRISTQLVRPGGVAGPNSNSEVGLGQIVSQAIDIRGGQKKQVLCRICEQPISARRFNKHACWCEQVVTKLSVVKENLMTLCRLHATWVDIPKAMGKYDNGRADGTAGNQAIQADATAFCAAIESVLRPDDVKQLLNPSSPEQRLLAIKQACAPSETKLLEHIDTAIASVRVVVDALDVLQQLITKADETTKLEFEKMRSSTGLSTVFGFPERTSASEFTVIDEVARGSFGVVLKGRKKTTGDVFAIKVLLKQDIGHKNFQERAIAERDIMLRVSNPWVVRLFWALESERRVFLVMEYVEGGDMATILADLGYLSLEGAQFYLAELVVAIEYLHSMHVVHRDVKPSNMLVGRDGHLKLTDFGLSSACFLSPHSMQQTVGTPDYLAPELLLGLGHSYTADWWSVGITFWEMLFGVPTFHAKDMETVFNNILAGEIEWPEEAEEFPEELKSFITGLLEPEPTKRLGFGGASEVKNHPFFAGVDWDNLRSKTPDFIPTPTQERYQGASQDVQEFFASIDKSNKNAQARNLSMPKGFAHTSIPGLIYLNKPIAQQQQDQG